MSGHVPEGRAAEENEVRPNSSGGMDGSCTTAAAFGAPPPPIPSRPAPALDPSRSGSESGGSAAAAPPSAAPGTTNAETSSYSLSTSPGAVPPALRPVVAASSPSSSSDSSPTPHTPPLFAERFLPPPVDASHVISSAAPSSLPIELPAIRAENVPIPIPSSVVSPSSAPPYPSAPTAKSPIISANAANLRLLTPFERWTVRASESQFNALAGAIGGFTSGIFTCPLDVIKTKLQAQGGFAALQQAGAAGAVAGTASASASAAGHTHHRLYNGLVGTARVIWRDEGIRGMYRGLGPIIMGYLPTWAVWFTVYNKSKVWLRERYHIQNTFVINFWSSVVAGASSTIVTNPIWVIKTRLMSQMPRATSAGAGAGAGISTGTPTSRPTLSTPWHYNSTLDAARKMYTTEGVLSFYSGLTPALLGLTHVAVQFPAYEYLKTKFTGRGMGESPGDGEAPAHWLGVLSATILSKVLASSLTYPHEVIRTRLQTQRRPANKPPLPSNVRNGGQAGAAQSPETPRYKGIVTTFRTILREEGWRAFYAGLGTNMMRAVPAATVTMLTYEYVMRSLKQKRHDARHTLEGL